MPFEKPLNIFISYAHEDRDLMLKLVKHLSTLKREHKIAIWEDGEILAGQYWNEEIKKKLAASHIAILIVSSDFTASEYIWEIEVPMMYKRSDRGENFRIIPVLARECHFEDNIAKIGMLPKNEDNDILPLVSKTWDTLDTPYHNVVKELINVINDLKPKLESADSILNQAPKLSLENIWEKIPLRSTLDSLKLLDCDREVEYGETLLPHFSERVSEDRNLFYFVSGCGTQKPESLVKRFIKEHEKFLDLNFYKTEVPQILSITIDPDTTNSMILDHVLTVAIAGEIHTKDYESERFYKHVNSYQQKRNGLRQVLVYKIHELCWSKDVAKHLKNIIYKFSLLPKDCHRFIFFFILEIEELHKVYHVENHISKKRLQGIEELCQASFECDCLPDLKQINLLNSVSSRDVKNWLKAIIDDRRCTEQPVDYYVNMIIKYLLAEMDENERNYYREGFFNMDRLEIMQRYAFQYLTR